MRFQTVPTEYRVTERGLRKSTKLRDNPKCMHYSRLMTALKSFVGLGENFAEEDGWRNDLNYFLHLGISGEAFTLCHSACCLMEENCWDNAFPGDCFATEGIQYHLIADEKIATKDAVLNPDTIIDETARHLLTDWPAIFMYEKM